MSKRRRLIVILTCLTVTIGLVAPFLGPTEPHYRDVSLSEWLSLEKAHRFRGLRFIVHSTPFQEIPDVETLGAEAPEAIRHIGTNAIPWLIKWMNVPRNSWKTKLDKSIAKLPPAVRPNKLPEWLAATKDRERASLAYRGFVVLGPAAAPAIPDLVKVACNSRALGSASAANILAGLKPPAVPALLSLLTNCPQPNVRIRVLQCLGYLGAEASEAIPTIVSCLNDSDEGLATISAATLSRIRRRPDLAVPGLIAALDDSRNSVRLAAAKALGDFGSDAWPATEKLQTLLAKPDISLSQEAERTLWKIAPTMWPDPSTGEVFPHFDGFNPQP